MDHAASHYAHQMPPPDAHYAQQQQHWSPAPHLLPPSHGASPYHSPAAAPPTQLADQQQAFPHFFHAPGPSPTAAHGLERSSSLSLNLSALSVTSPTNLSPINPSPHPSSTNLSPVTPISPIAMSTTPQQHVFVSPPLAQAHRNVPSFAYPPVDQPLRYDHAQYDLAPTRPPTRSRSSSSSDKSVPRKRSFSGAVTPMAVNMEESVYESAGPSLDLSTPASFDEVEMGYVGLDAQNSPIDGSSSGGEQEDHFGKPSEHLAGSLAGLHAQNAANQAKTTGTNNFVTKLYQYAAALSPAPLTSSHAAG